MVDNADTLAMKVNLYISGRKLKNKDILSKSDPQCLIYEQNKQGSWV